MVLDMAEVSHISYGWTRLFSQRLLLSGNMVLGIISRALNLNPTDPLFSSSCRFVAFYLDTIERVFTVKRNVVD